MIWFQEFQDYEIIGKAGKLIRILRLMRILRIFKMVGKNIWTGFPIFFKKIFEQVRHFVGLQSLVYTIYQAYKVKKTNAQCRSRVGLGWHFHILTHCLMLSYLSDTWSCYMAFPCISRYLFVAFLSKVKPHFTVLRKIFIYMYIYIYNNSIKRVTPG